MTNSNITVSCGTSGNISEITGLVAQSGELELANSNILFYIENPVDKFVGLVGEQQGKASITKITLEGEITANTSAFGMFQTTQGTVQLQNSQINLSLIAANNNSVALLVKNATNQFNVTNCELNSTVSQGSLDI